MTDTGEHMSGGAINLSNWSAEQKSSATEEVAQPTPVPEQSTVIVAGFGGTTEPQPVVESSSAPVESAEPAAAAPAKPHVGSRGTATVGATKMPDMGILNQFMQDQEIGEVMVNGMLSIYIDRKGKLVDSGLKFNSHEEIWEIAERMVKSVGQELPKDRPIIDSRLPDGSRVNIIAPPMALDGVSMSIRKFPSRRNHAGCDGGSPVS